VFEVVYPGDESAITVAKLNLIYCCSLIFCHSSFGFLPVRCTPLLYRGIPLIMVGLLANTRLQIDNNIVMD
jgi:hypothetical protein